MPFPAPMPITADDDAIRAALDQAVLPPLLPALAHATGDLSLLRPELRPDPLLLGDPTGGLTPAQESAIRALALDVLIRYRDGGCRLAPAPSHADLEEIMAFAVGGLPMGEYVPLLAEELSITGEDLRAPGWRADEVAPGVAFRVAIIGAGMSGLLAAYRLQQVGIPFVIVEKNDEVGGTWWENTYPGCRVDNPNHLYSYSFAQKDDWPQHYSTQEALFEYFRAFADEHDLRRHVRFDTEVRSVTFDDATSTWALQVRSADGSEETIEANAVVSAVGQLNRPLMPDIPGIDTFEGPWFHSARWDHGVDLRGKRVAVIGTGASAAQFIPIVAEEAGELLVFQRTPNWLGPTPDYHEDVSDGLRWLYTHVPFYSQWHRFWIFWRTADGVLPGVTVDPAWEPRDRSVSPLNEEIRVLMAMYLELEFADRPDLLAKVMPSYPPAAKRVIRDNGVWARTLKRDDVQLLTEGIAEVTPRGVRTVDGQEHPVDVIVYGTGFQASHFLEPMRVTGRGGVDLHQQWGGDARAYLGVTVPGFPNLFCLYGPNTNIVINGSIIYFSECGVRYILGLLRLVLEGGHRAVDVRRDVHDAFNERVDAQNRMMAWGASAVNSWYKSASGRVSQNWPFTLLEYWQWTKAPDPADYALLD
ncbi:MAG: NAD(P)/FAD-dependent oxidoreductase [Acidimicrobiales bacterium]|nr:NAD(P)/FAD-dependent oxidoreductase [Acidimicrobiales bacterium]